MVTNRKLLPDVFNLSSLLGALEEDVKAQPGHPAAHVFDVFSLSSLARALDEDIEAAERNHERMNVDDEWREFSPVPSLVEETKHKPMVPSRKAEKLPIRAQIDVSTTSQPCSSKVKVEDLDWRAAKVRSSKAIAPPSNQVSTSTSIKKSNTDEDVFLASNHQTSNLAAGNQWLKVSRTPGRNIDNESVLLEDASMDKSHLAIAHPLVEDADSIEEPSTDGDLFLSPSYGTSNGNWLKTSRTPGRNLDNDSVLHEDASIDQSYLAVAHPLVEDVDDTEESVIDEDFFLGSNRGSDTENGWLKVSRTPGRNLDNDSVLLEDASIDKSYLAVAYPLVEDADSGHSTTDKDLIEDDLFLGSNRGPNTEKGWLKVSRTPGRNLDNDSVLLEDASIDKSYLAVAYPLVEEADSEHSTAAEDFFLTSHRELSNRAVNDSWLKVSRTPGHNVDNNSVLAEDASIDKSFLAVAYPLMEDTDSDQSTSNEDIFLTSNRESSNRGIEDCWLKVSRTPGRNVDNDSVLPEDATVDKSYLAIAYPLVEDAEPIEQSASDFFLASHLRSSKPAFRLKTSRTPGRNVDNDSVLAEDATVDKSYLALAYPPKKEDSASTSGSFLEDDASECNVSFQRLDEIEFFDVVAQSTPTRKSGLGNESQDFEPRATSTHASSRLEEDEDEDEEDLILLRQLEGHVNVNSNNKCMQLMKAMDQIPDSNEVLALCHRLQGSSSAHSSSAYPILKFFQDSMPWMDFISSLDLSTMFQDSSISLLSHIWDFSKSVGRYLSDLNF